MDNDASEIEKSLIRTTLKESELSVQFDHLNLDLEDTKGSIHKICDYLKKETVAWSTPEEIFSFNCKTISVEEFTEELEELQEDIADYTLSIGNKTMFYVNTAWHEGTAQFKKSNLNQKYVPRSDKATKKVTYFLAQSYIPSTNSEQKRILSYLDVEKNIINWEAVCNNLKALALSSGYSKNDIKQSLLSTIRLTNMNETLYQDLE